MKLTAISIFGCLLFGAAAHADVLTVNFEDVAVPSGGFEFDDPFSVKSGPCNFTTVGFGGLENDADGSMNGTTHLFGSDITMTCGGVFDLIQWDMGSDYTETSFDWFTDLYYADGSSVIGAGASLNGFGFITWFALDPDFTSDLVSLRWYSDPFAVDPVFGGVPQLAIDNIVVRVPEPGALGLLGIGLLGVGLARRRRIP